MSDSKLKYSDDLQDKRQAQREDSIDKVYQIIRDACSEEYARAI